VSAAPGWYDAGTPGRVRWWDGVQWTAAEQVVSTAPAMGWYPTAGGPLRWWDGQRWTGLRVKNGVPGTDWATSEQPAMAWVFGGVFLALAGLQFAVGALGSIASPNGFLTMLLAGLWFAIAVQSGAVRRIPVPVEAPVVLEAVRPLPGEQEGPGAGWYPVAPRTTRWWSGARWGEYVGTAYGVRPTFHGARSLRILTVLCWVLLGLGVLTLLAGVLLLVLGAAAASASWMAFLGVFLLIAGIVVAVLGAALLLMSRYQRRALVVPAGPPAAPPAAPLV
jgi:hypothetical protein